MFKNKGIVTGSIVIIAVAIISMIAVSFIVPKDKEKIVSHSFDDKSVEVVNNAMKGCKGFSTQDILESCGQTKIEFPLLSATYYDEEDKTLEVTDKNSNRYAVLMNSDYSVYAIFDLQAEEYIYAEYE